MSGPRGARSRGDRRRAFPHGTGPRVQLAWRTLSRPHRLARDLRSPNTTTWFGDIDPRSLAVMVAIQRRQHPDRRAWRTAGEVVRVVRRSGRVICSLPRSGMHWTHVMLMSALDLSDGGDGEYDYEAASGIRASEQWSSRNLQYLWTSAPDALLFSCAGLRPSDVPPTAFMVSHVPLQHRPFDVTRMRPLLVVRHPTGSLPSLMHYEGIDRVATDDRLRAALLRRTAQYLEFWAEQRRARPVGDAHHPLVVRYEDLQSDAVGQLRRVAEHWDLDITVEHARRAVALSSRDRMLAKTGDASSRRITLGDHDLPPNVASAIEETLQRPVVRKALDALGYPDGEPLARRSAPPASPDTPEDPG